MTNSLLTLQNRKVYKYVGITYSMYFKIKTIKGRKYKYAEKLDYTKYSSLKDKINAILDNHLEDD